MSRTLNVKYSLTKIGRTILRYKNLTGDKLRLNIGEFTSFPSVDRNLIALFTYS